MGFWLVMKVHGAGCFGFTPMFISLSSERKKVPQQICLSYWLSLPPGKGRWANHVKKTTGGRGARGLPIATSQDTPRAGRGGGRGRRGGRGGSRPSRPDPDGTCQLIFDNLVNALENHFNGTTSSGALEVHKCSALIGQITSLSLLVIYRSLYRC